MLRFDIGGNYDEMKPLFMYIHRRYDTHFFFTQLVLGLLLSLFLRVPGARARWMFSLSRGKRSVAVQPYNDMT